MNYAKQFLGKPSTTHPFLLTKITMGKGELKCDGSKTMARRFQLTNVLHVDNLIQQIKSINFGQICHLRLLVWY